MAKIVAMGGITREEASRAIALYIEEPEYHTFNVTMLLLRQIGLYYGPDESAKIVRDLELTRYMGIEETGHG